MTIDEIKDAGMFVEVEVLSEDETGALAMISDIEAKLGLDSAEIVTRPYRDILYGPVGLLLDCSKKPDCPFILRLENT